MHNSAEHELLNAHKHKSIKKFNFLLSDMPRMLFSLLINAKMPKIDYILTFMSENNARLS